MYRRNLQKYLLLRKVVQATMYYHGLLLSVSVKHTGGGLGIGVGVVRLNCAEFLLDVDSERAWLTKTVDYEELSVILVHVSVGYPVGFELDLSMHEQ
jgi:hypothetical protein